MRAPVTTHEYSSEARWFRENRARKQFPVRMPQEGHDWLVQEALSLGMPAYQWLDQFLLTEIHALQDPNLCGPGLPGLRECLGPCLVRSYNLTPEVHRLVRRHGGAQLVRALVAARINQDPLYPNVDW